MQADGARRARLLRAMGLTPMQLRTTEHAAPVTLEVQGEPECDADGWVDVALVIPAGVASSHLDLLGRAMTAFGARFARAARITAAEGTIRDALPAARAYLAFGEEQARALGRELDAAVMARAEVVLLDAPEQLVSAQGKRRLWVAVNALRRRWRLQNL